MHVARLACSLLVSVALISMALPASASGHVLAFHQDVLQWGCLGARSTAVPTVCFEFHDYSIPAGADHFSVGAMSGNFGSVTKQHGIHQGGNVDACFLASNGVEIGCVQTGGDENAAIPGGAATIRIFLGGSVANVGTPEFDVEYGLWLFA